MASTYAQHTRDVQRAIWWTQMHGSNPLSGDQYDTPADRARAVARTSARLPPAGGSDTRRPPAVQRPPAPASASPGARTHAQQQQHQQRRGSTSTGSSGRSVADLPMLAASAYGYGYDEDDDAMDADVLALADARRYGGAYTYDGASTCTSGTTDSCMAGAVGGGAGYGGSESSWPLSPQTTSQAYAAQLPHTKRVHHPQQQQQQQQQQHAYAAMMDIAGDRRSPRSDDDTSSGISLSQASSVPSSKEDEREAEDLFESRRLAREAYERQVAMAQLRLRDFHGSNPVTVNTPRAWHESASTSSVLDRPLSAAELGKAGGRASGRRHVAHDAAARGQAQSSRDARVPLTPRAADVFLRPDAYSLERDQVRRDHQHRTSSVGPRMVRRFSASAPAACQFFTMFPKVGPLDAPSECSVRSSSTSRAASSGHVLYYESSARS